MEAVTVAQTILEQLGGCKFIAMTGSKNLIWDPKAEIPYLGMTLATNKVKAKYLKIELMLNDTYTMTFLNVHGNEVEKKENVYCDMLCFMFTKITGLFTSL